MRGLSLTPKLSSVEELAPEQAARRAVTIGRKVRPPAVPARVVARPRLSRLLGSLLRRHGVLVVAATAGSGKTTAVLEAVGEDGAELAWLTVDRSDAAPGRLVAYLESALSERVPALAGRATDALADGFSHPEAAGLLVDSLGKRELIVVLDDLERLDDAAEAWDAISSFLRQAPPTVRIVLISRRSLPASCELPPPPTVAWLDERELAFTVEEAAAALASSGREGLDAEQVVEATGGWVTGVLFESWRSSAHVAGAGGEADPLFGYLGSHILTQLRSPVRTFLVESAILDEVSAARAAALELPDAAATLAELRAAHLPVAWDGEATMRCHPRFREYLMALLERGSAERLHRLRLLHGRLLAAEGHFEEATDELLRVGARSEAAACAESSILPVVERLDLEQAQRWLAALTISGEPRPTPFAVAELMLCWAEEDYRGTERVADELAARGERAEVARRSPRAAALMIWCYYMRGRPADAEAIIAVSSGAEVQAAAYLVAGDDERPPRPELGGGPFDLFILFADYFSGRLGAVEPASGSRWADSVVTAWKIAVLRANGRTGKAIEMYERAVAESSCPLGMLTFLGPELYVDAGDVPKARRAMAAGRTRYQEIGAPGWAACVTFAEARLELRCEGDPAAARRALDAIDAGAFAGGHLFRGTLGVWYGLADLLDGRDEEALAGLRTTVELMHSTGGHIELPAAAIHLSEAEWRHGDEEAADAAADLALEAAHAQGSNHILLQGLSDFPAVVSRKIDAELRTDSPWHELGRALMTRQVAVPGYGEHTVLVREFGEAAIVIDGEKVRVALSKCLDLLAFLATREGGAADRAELLGALFDGRDDRSARSYLRQVIHRLRGLLPEETLISDGEVLRLGERVTVSSESEQLLAGLAEAARLSGANRLRAILDALTVSEHGCYLPRLEAEWARQRAVEVDERCLDARLEAAELAFAGGDYPLARQLCEEVVGDDRFRERGWQLLIRVATEVGDSDGAALALRRCEAALAEIGVKPTDVTRALVAA